MTMIIMKNDWNFLWSNENDCVCILNQRYTHELKSKRDVLHHCAYIPATLGSFVFDQMRFDTAVWMPACVFIHSYLKALHFCSFVIASLFACHIRVCVWNKLYSTVLYDSVSSVGIMIFFTACILLCYAVLVLTNRHTLSTAQHNIPPILFVNLNMTSALYTRC